MTAEDVVRLGPMLMLAGLSIAWLAQVSERTIGFGFLPDIALGLIGSLAAGLAGLVVWATRSASTGMLAMFWTGAAGALLVIAAQRGVWRAAPLRS